jgi:hypothetical protein
VLYLPRATKSSPAEVGSVHRSVVSIDLSKIQPCECMKIRKLNMATVVGPGQLVQIRMRSVVK